MKHSVAALALMLLTHAAVATPELERGYQAFESGDVEAAVAIWSVLAYSGDPTAQLNLGQLYRLGTGVAADDREAVKWYSMAAQQGSETAQYNLLLMKEEGRASAADLALAFAGKTNTPQLKPNHGKEAGRQNAPKLRQQGDWLSTLPRDGFLIQIIASSDKLAIEQHISEHLSGINPSTGTVKTSKQGQEWYIAVMGPFASKEMASQARAELPADVQKGGPWIRSVASLVELARPQK